MYNFIVLCIDCLRYDYLKRSLETLPHLSSLIEKRGISFNFAYTTAPWTYPATNSILTGLYPHNHGARQKGMLKESVKEPWPQKMNPNVSTIFYDLKNLGYYTLGVSTIFWTLNRECIYHGCDKIIRSEDQDVFYKNAKAEWVIESFIKTYNHEIKNNPFFAYLHFSDLHRPYDLDVAIRNSTEYIEIMNGIEEWNIKQYSHQPEKASMFRENKKKLYNALTNYLNTQIEKLVDFLFDKKIFDDTVIIITSDHGEEFWDHIDFEKRYYYCGNKSKNEWLMGTGHGHTMFNELVRIPLIVINPKIDLNDQVLNFPVSLIDIFPSILEMIERNPSRDVDGISFLNTYSRRELLIESTLYGFERKALICGALKYIYSPEENHFVIYDVSKDPSELNQEAGIASDTIRAKLDSYFAVDRSEFALGQQDESFYEVRGKNQ